MVPLEGIEPPTLALRKPCSTPELQRRWVKALSGSPPGRQRVHKMPSSTPSQGPGQRATLPPLFPFSGDRFHALRAV